MEALRLKILQFSFFRYATTRQLTKFAIVGCANTIVDFSVYILLTRGWLGFHLHFLIGNLIAFFASVVNSYFLNKRWTFRNLDTRHHIQFAKFFLVNTITLSLYEILLFLFIDRFHLFDLTAKLIAVAIVTAWNFSANKFWTFRNG